MKSKQIATCGLLTTVALVLSYIESMIPLSIAVPGVKIGLANIAIVFALYKLGAPAAWMISGMRVAIVAALFGGFTAIAYSACGAACSLLVMMVAKRAFSCVGTSVAGGIAHNVGQIACAIALLGAKQIAYYLPMLIVSGTVSGIAIGALAGVLVARIMPTS